MIFGIQPELLVLVLGLLGVIAMLQSLPDVRKKHLVLQVLFAVGILTQVLTQLFQYGNATWNRVAFERNTAFALHAFSEGDVDLLKRLAPDNPLRCSTFLSEVLYRCDSAKLPIGRSRDKTSTKMHLLFSAYRR